MSLEHRGGERPPVVLTAEFAGRIYGRTQSFPGATRLIDLRIAPPSLPLDQYQYYGYIANPNHPAGWGEFYSSLEQRQRKTFSEVLKAAIKSGFGTIEQIRGANEEQLRFRRGEGGKRERTAISENAASFLKTAFGPEVPQTQG